MSDSRHFTVELTSRDSFALPAYVALPKGRARGAIVVLQEIFGANSHIRNVADAYAAEGFLAVAPAMFHRVKEGVELGYTADDVTIGAALKAKVEALKSQQENLLVPLMMEDVQAAVNYAGVVAGMNTQDTMVGRQGTRVGVVGYCWGGLLTWRAASLLSGISAAVPYYGGGVTLGDEAARQPQCPVLCHFADQDKHITMPSVEAFKSAQKAVDVQVYAADHGFNCDQRGSWNEPAAKLAFERTLTFFGKHVG